MRAALLNSTSSQPRSPSSFSLSSSKKNSLKQIKENKEKVKLNNQLPYLVGNIVEVLDPSPGEGSDGEGDEGEEDGAAADADAGRQGKCVVLKTSTRQTVFLPVVGLVDAETLKPGDLVGVNKDSYLVLVRGFFLSFFLFEKRVEKREKTRRRKRQKRRRRKT
jgi:ATP-dependent 26S proteasome regulatory subunit